jgi:NAD(P)-dependent dehydrogenase (short-subunit alcohol dehydrogenase family)
MDANQSSEAPEATTALHGQVALVTGGGRGIGRAIAENLAAAGASVAVLARSAEQVAETVALIETAQGRANGYVADVTDMAAVQAAVQDIEVSLGAIDLLVNNAAVLGGDAGPSWEVDPDLWWRCQEINLRGPFFCARAILPGMVARRRGRIINVASAAGLFGFRYASAYATSKTSLIRWSETLASETEEYGIAVFAIHPGDVMTDMLQEVVSEKNERWMPWAREHFAKSHIPVEHATALVQWLAAGKGDALSGCYLSIFDDVEQMAAQAETIQQKDLHKLRLRT